MNEPLQHQKGSRSSLIALVAGLVVGMGAMFLHFSGRLSPIYHTLGLHFLMTPSEKSAPNGPGGNGMADMPGMPGMKMSASTGAAEPSSLPGYAKVTITPERQQLIGVRTGKVEHGRLLMWVSAVGIIEPDQTRQARIHTRISGWVTKLYANFVGQNMEKGDPLLEIYSPDLLATQEEFLIALDGGQKALADSARRRLELWGVPADEIKELEKTKKSRETLMLRSPIAGRVLERNVLEGTRVEPVMELYRIADLSVVWLQARVYEYELPHVEIGQPVSITLASQPDTTIKGKVSFIEPVLQETTRTVKVRVVIDNPKDQYKPGMYADLRIDHDMGHGLLVPQEAVLRTGTRNLAFRVLPESRFEPVEVKIGAPFGDRYEVLSGLSEGDTVVTSAVFLIDAESRLKSATSMMGGHQHGSGTTPTKESEKKAGHEHKHH